MIQEKKTVDELKKIANNARVDIVEMLVKAQSGHPGGSLSVIDILVCLFFNIMNIDPENPKWEGRDRFHLSKGHACPALYAVLSQAGYFSSDKLAGLRQFGNVLQGHPHPKAPGIEVASGSLGQGLSIACGMALADRLAKKETFVYTVLGDGELQEGQCWEAALFAAQFRLDNLVAFIDNNGLQIDGRNEEVIDVQPLDEKFASFGFHVLMIDGHDIEAILRAVAEAKKVSGKPTVIIAKTVKGKGVSFMENNLDFHGRTPVGAEIEQALKELRGE